MKKILMAILMITLIGSGLFAEEKVDIRDYDSDDGLTAADIYKMAPGLEGSTLGDIKLDDLLKLGETMSVIQQEERYVERAAFSSLAVPGTGQFITGDYGLGALQFGMHLLIVGGTAYGTWLVLPEDLKNSLDNYGETKTYFETLTYSELLPATGVVLGGMLLNGILAGWSASGAADSAMENIKNGTVKFSPDLRLVDGLPFIGASFHY